HPEVAHARKERFAETPLAPDRARARHELALDELPHRRAEQLVLGAGVQVVGHGAALSRTPPPAPASADSVPARLERAALRGEHGRQRRREARAAVPLQLHIEGEWKIPSHGSPSLRTSGVTARWKPFQGRGARSCAGSGQGGRPSAAARSASGSTADSGDVSFAFGAAPSTRSTAPEMNAAAGESRKQIAADTSDSVPSRCDGTASRSSRRKRCIQSGYVSMPEDATQPGATAFTRTPDGAHSTAAVSVKLTMPSRAAPE